MNIIACFDEVNDAAETMREKQGADAHVRDASRVRIVAEALVRDESCIAHVVPPEDGVQCDQDLELAATLARVLAHDELHEVRGSEEHLGPTLRWRWSTKVFSDGTRNGVRLWHHRAFGVEARRYGAPHAELSLSIAWWALATPYQRERALYDLLSRMDRNGKLQKPDFIGVASSWQRYGVEGVAEMQAVEGARTHAATVEAVRVWAEDQDRQLLLWDAVPVDAGERAAVLYRASSTLPKHMREKVTVTVSTPTRSVTLSQEQVKAAIDVIEKKGRKRAKEHAAGGDA